MVSFLDYFLPADNGLNPQQYDQANSSGLINAAATIANLNAPHQGPAATLPQLLLGGVQGYGTGANDVLKNFYANQNTQAETMQNKDKAIMSNLAAQRAQTYFNPQGSNNGMAAALQPQTAPQPAAPANPNDLSSYYGTPTTPLTNSQIHVESGGNPNAVSPKGATGLMQVMPATGASPGFGVTPQQGPADNVRMGQDYQQAMIQKYGDVPTGLMAYNWGPGNVDKWIAAGRPAQMVPQETKNYVAQVMAGAPGASGSAPSAPVQTAGAAPALATPTGGTTAFGQNTSQMARSIYKQGMDQMMLGQPGGDALIKQAIELDPSITYEKSYVTSKGTAEGALPSQTALEDHKAGLIPHDQQVMINGKLYTVPSNNAAAAQGAVPANAGAPGDNVSTAIPAGASAMATKQGEDMAAAQQTAINFDARMQSAKETLKQALVASKTAPAGYGTESYRNLDNQLASTTIPFTNAHLSGGEASRSHDVLASLNAQLLTQEIPALAQGAGGRIDIPLVNAAKEASQLPLDAAPATKAKVIQTLMDNLDRVQRNYHNSVNLQPANTSASASGTGGWSATRMN